MLNKTMTLQKDLKNESQNTVAYFSGQITDGLGNMNISIQIIDREYVQNNINFNQEFDSFIEEIKREAMGFGWETLKQE